DALGVLVGLGPGSGPAGGHIGGVETHDVGLRQGEADVDQLDPAAVTERVNGFEATERHGQRGVHSGAFDRTSLQVDAAGDVDGHRRDARLVDGGEYLCGGRAQRTGAGYADDTVV